MKKNSTDIRQSDFIAERKGSIKEQYSFLKKIGSGAYSQVYLASHKISEQPRCVKVIAREDLGYDDEDVMNEVKILRDMDHPNIMKIFEYYVTERHIYIVSEFLSGGELFDRIIEAKHFDEAKAAIYMEQILSAVSYLHKHQVIHRDIKPENIVFETKDKSSNLKLVDFGTSKKLVGNEKLKARMGTAYYIAPEVLRGKYDQKCDVWSCGVIMYIFLFGGPPFNGKTDEDIFAKIKKGIFSFPEKEANKISSEARALITRMLTLSMDKRPSADEVLKDPWFRLLAKGPQSQPSLEVINKLKNFKSQYYFQKAILIYFVNFFGLKEEKEQLLKVFKSIDTDHDGQLTKEELINAYKKVSKSANYEADVEEIFKKIDFNDTAAIDFSEFLVANINYKHSINDKRLKQIFQIIDKDKNGFLEMNELKEFFNLWGKDGDFLLQQFLAEVDKNKDGVISYEEFRSVMQDYIDSI